MSTAKGGAPRGPRDPVKKAKIIIALAEGTESRKQIAKRFGVSASLVDSYAAEMKEETGKSSIDALQDRVLAEIATFMCTIMGALTAQAQLLSDIDFLRNRCNSEKGTSDVIAHTRALTNELERVVRLQRAGHASERDALPERVEAEIVE